MLVKTITCEICGSDSYAKKFHEEFIETILEIPGPFNLTTRDSGILGDEFFREALDCGPQTNRTVGVGNLVYLAPTLLRKARLTIGYSSGIRGGFCIILATFGINYGACT
ncbi:MAG: hypothetical protein CMP95_03410 [Gammaproteobacteria bacterium]|uniref:Uncharacterized protein n=1 Tax=OM182 bacterium TaxID=2510334 RepID=A0A520S5P2_9GAMM|nr:hypothetical protein [Gammaproteobacteria bacterium]OUV68449.1 MAG: hypothetical protein CBC93_01825 [Gammaproteobacteria bacterium TMED133]RZO77805.1 MAG: hypothetical protein EVA68_00850 [OM182 bacterium]